MNYLTQIIDYIIESFIHTWPYLLLTIPIAVAVKMSGASRHINRALGARPIQAIILATIVGAFSPLCSCSVIPVIAALLIGGVPLAPVMSFWLASPSMDPEIFLLTVSSLGWELAIWRLSTTVIMSLSGGFITHALVQRGWLGSNFVRDTQTTQTISISDMLKVSWNFIVTKFNTFWVPETAAALVDSNATLIKEDQITTNTASPCEGSTSCQEKDEVKPIPISTDNAEKVSESRFWKRLVKETWSAAIMVTKFMLLAWFLGALIRLYIPESWITSILGSDNPWSIITAALFGIPVYTSSLAAMPLVGGLLAQGMNPAAALAFLIAGPTTTLPAMSAVWGLVNRRVFFLYISLSLVSAVLAGFIYQVFL